MLNYQILAITRNENAKKQIVKTHHENRNITAVLKRSIQNELSEENVIFYYSVIRYLTAAF